MKLFERCRSLCKILIVLCILIGIVLGVSQNFIHGRLTGYERTEQFTQPHRNLEDNS